MENKDKGLTVPKRQLGRKYPKCPRIFLPNLSAQAQKFWISIKKGFIIHWAFVVRATMQCVQAKSTVALKCSETAGKLQGVPEL